MEEGIKPEWYVVKVHSGFEQHVSASISQAIDSLKLKDKILEVLIPVEKQVRIKGGKRVEKEEKIYPGCILVHMVLNDQTWYAINNIEHVSCFLGSRSRAETLSQEEVDSIKNRMKSENVKTNPDFKVGSTVKIIEGPFANLDGKIGEVDMDKGQAVVLIPMFGRETPVKLDLFQIRSI